MNNEIYEYIRSRKGRKTVRNAQGQPRRIGGEKIGVVLATTHPRGEGLPPQIILGWSQTNRKAKDVFDKNKALGLARKRALDGTPADIKVPSEAAKIHARLAERAVAYFKGATL